MAKGSIRFDDLINVEVAVDPTQAAGSKLLSAVNLVDGQSLGGGGGSSDFITLTFEYLGVGLEAYISILSDLSDLNSDLITYYFSHKEGAPKPYQIGIPASLSNICFVDYDEVVDDVEGDYTLSVVDGYNVYKFNGDCTIIFLR